MLRCGQDPFPKGEVFIGNEQDGYGVHAGVARSPTRSGSRPDVSALDSASGSGSGAALVLTPVDDRQSSESLHTNPSLNQNHTQRPSTTDIQASSFAVMKTY